MTGNPLRLTSFLLAVAGVMLGSGSEEALATVATDPSNLPLLAPGNHVGMIVGFNPSAPPATAAAIEARWDEAMAAGMRIGRVQIDWVDIEPLANEYDLAEIEEQLDALFDDGLQQFLLLTTFDSEGSLAPPDLRARIASGEIGYDHPEVVERFGSLLDRVVPMLVSRGGWVLAIANEPGNVLDDLDAATRQRVTGELLEFFAAARARIHAIEPGLAMTVTIREQEPANELPFLDVVDVVSYNFYCGRFDNDLAVETDPARIRGFIDAMLATAGNRPVIFQELGCHAGWEDRPSPTGATPEQQRQFFEVVFAEIENRPRLRATVVFQLVDWDPALVEEHYSRPFREAGLPESFIQQFAESLESVGLLRYEDGSVRPAWASFVDALAGGPCAPGPTTACVVGTRFKVEIQWTDFEGVTRDAFVASAGTSDTALFYWTNPDNWEVLIKGIDACSFNNKFWIYFAAATNVGYRVTVTDTVAGGAPRIYTNPVGNPAQATNDSGAFNCP